MNYSKIENGKIIGRYNCDTAKGKERGWIKTGHLDPEPHEGWSYDEASKKFIAPVVVEYVAPTKLTDIDLTTALKEDEKDLILKKLAQDMIDKGIT